MRPFILLALACLPLTACMTGPTPVSPPQNLDAGRTSNSGSAAPGTIR